MNRTKIKDLLSVGLAIGLAGVCSQVIQAQQVNGELGSPNATTTIDGKQLPPPPRNLGA